MEDDIRKRAEDIASLRGAMRRLGYQVDDLAVNVKTAASYTPLLRARVETAIAAVWDARLEIRSKKVRAK